MLKTVGAESLVSLFITSTVTLYISITILVSTILCLAEGDTLSGIWRNCCFWSLPYYLVGAAVSGAIVLASHNGHGMLSSVFLLMMALVYVSYRAQVRNAVQGPIVA